MLWQDQRRKGCAVFSEFAGKNVLLIDDSVVRGTTSRVVINKAYAVEAGKLKFASCSPAIR